MNKKRKQKIYNIAGAEYEINYFEEDGKITMLGLIKDGIGNILDYNSQEYKSIEGQIYLYLCMDKVLTEE